MMAKIHGILFKDQPLVIVIDIDGSDTFLQLRNKIHKAQKAHLHHSVLSRQLRLWKLRSPVQKDNQDDDELKRIYTSLNNSDKKPHGLEKVRLTDKVADILNMSQEQEQLIQILIRVELNNLFVILEPFKSSLSLTLPNCACYIHARLDARMLEKNLIFELSEDPPAFLLQYKNNLIQKRLYQVPISTTNPELALVETRLRDASKEPRNFFQVVENMPEDMSRYVNREESIHYLGALGAGTPGRDDIFATGKTAHIIALIHEISWRFGPKYRSTNILYNHKWTFPIIVGVTDTGEKFSLHPRSDLEMRIADFPFLVGEVDSGAGGSDEVRLLLHASCIVRFANHLRKSKESHSIVVSAIYFDGAMKAKWHKVYQTNPSEREVTFSTDIFDLSQRIDRFIFLHALYNFIGCAWDYSFLLKDLDEIEPAKATITHLKALASAKTHGSAKRKLQDDDDSDSGDQGQSGSGQQTGNQNAFEQGLVGRELANAGYLLTPDLGLGRPLRWQIGPHAHQATQSSEGTQVFLKVLNCQEELKILRHFAQDTSPKNHTITLLQDLHLSIGDVIVLPWRTPLWCALDELNFEQRPRTVASLRSQFLEGVSFLHSHGVAHLDLKPDNIVVHNDALSAILRLSITDFDAAEFINGVETMITELRGTLGWMAPEVEANKGPYSPVLADRWSCGKMVRYFAQYISPLTSKEDDAAMEFASRLLLKDPQSRPPLDQYDQSTIFLPLKRPLLLPMNPSKRCREELAL